MSPVHAAADAFQLIGLFTAGLGAIFFLTDHRGRASRALALCLLVLGFRLWLATHELAAPTVPVTVLARLAEMLAILAGMEWARRVADTTRPRLRRSARGLLLAAQGLVVVYSGLSLGYLVLAPEQAMTPDGGFIRVRAIEWAIFAPVLGTALLLSTIGILLLVFGGSDPAEAIRLRALMAAAPFLFAGLLVQAETVPLVMAVGLLVFLFGAMRYLMVMGRRGALWGQFLAPEVVALLRRRGPEEVLRRERRAVSAVFCDLRGFTAYSARHDSTAVMALLEQFYAATGAAAAAEGATVKDHAGDGVLLLLGAPLPQPDHAARALRLGQRLRDDLAPLLAAQGLGLGLGIASGEAMVGAIQGAGRLEYVAVGGAINLAARLCAEAGAGEILVDAATTGAMPAAERAALRPRAPFALKGFSAPVEASVL